jgi:uncharacterized membrane protein
MQERISDCVVIGDERTAGQDLEFSVRQLVEVALRALSPGVNDLFTAVAVIDRLGVSLALAMARGTAQRVQYDEHGMVRVIAPITTYQGLVDVAFNQIRQAGEGQAAILIRLLETLAQLAEQARNDGHRQVLTEHVNMVYRAGERSIEEPVDLAEIEKRRSIALAHIEGRSDDGMRSSDGSSQT